MWFSWDKKKKKEKKENRKREKVCACVMWV